MATFTKPNNASGTNHVLEVNVLRPSYPITTEVLHTIASPHGKVQRIVIHNRNETKVESLVEFDGVMSAETCKEAIHGADIYAGCCTLEVKYSKVCTGYVQSMYRDMYRVCAGICLKALSMVLISGFCSGPILECV